MKEVGQKGLASGLSHDIFGLRIVIWRRHNSFDAEASDKLRKEALPAQRSTVFGVDGLVCASFSFQSSPLGKVTRHSSRALIVLALPLFPVWSTKRLGLTFANSRDSRKLLNRAIPPPPTSL